MSFLIGLAVALTLLGLVLCCVLALSVCVYSFLPRRVR